MTYDIRDKLFILNETRYYTQDLYEIARFALDSYSRDPNSTYLFMNEIEVRYYYPKKGKKPEYFQTLLGEPAFIKPSQKNETGQIGIVKPTPKNFLQNPEILNDLESITCASGERAPNTLVRQLLYRMSRIIRGYSTSFRVTGRIPQLRAFQKERTEEHISWQRNLLTDFRKAGRIKYQIRMNRSQHQSNLNSLHFYKKRVEDGNDEFELLSSELGTLESTIRRGRIFEPNPVKEKKT